MVNSRSAADSSRLLRSSLEIPVNDDPICVGRHVDSFDGRELYSSTASPETGNDSRPPFFPAGRLPLRVAEAGRMLSCVRKWQLITGFTVAGCLGLAAAGHSQFSSVSDRVHAVLEGNWQSCREADGRYSERIYDNTLPGIGPFELHLGPYHEFALFRGVHDDHQAHRSPDNLLRPYNVEMHANRAHQKWEVAGLLIEVKLGGGGREECESWFITLKRANPSS